MHTLDHVLPVWDATRIERRVISAPIATTYDAMLTSDLRDAAVESWLVRALFALRFVPEPWSIAQGVRKLLPGHWLEFGSSGLEIGRWYDLATKRAPTIADADAARQGLRERLDAAVKARLVSDVPVGVFLSSGIDSALVAWALGSPAWWWLHFSELPWNVPEETLFASTQPRRLLAWLLKCVPIRRGGDRRRKIGRAHV